MSVATEAAERDSNLIIEQQLLDRLRTLEVATRSDVMACNGAMYQPLDDVVKDAMEAITNRRTGVTVVLETPGGYIHVAERIARILRHHYRRVDFVVPSYAMSAGTVLVMSGDAIHMDYASTLGPIDPQIDKGRGDWVPALGYLAQYERLIKKSADGLLTTAELAYLVQNFDPAELYRYEQERELSIALLEEWLVKYKFKNWKVTETSKTKVTKAMRVARAKEIGELLNKTDYWHSHSRGISMEALGRDVKLLIDDFDANATIGPAIRNYYRLLRDYQMRRGDYAMLIHTKEGYIGF
jgi:ClpP class serine protease